MMEPERALNVGKMLIEAYRKKGILGIRRLPDDILPDGVISGSPDHLLFLTFASFISYRQPATKFWKNARKAFTDKDTSSLFLPEKISDMESSEMQDLLDKHSLVEGRPEAVDIWKTIGVVLAKEFNSNPLDIFHNNDYNVTRVFKFMNSHVAANFQHISHKSKYFHLQNVLWLHPTVTFPHLLPQCGIWFYRRNPPTISKKVWLHSVLPILQFAY